MQALTNNAAALQTLYPNLGIVSSTNVFTNIYITNITAYFTNYPLDPVGTPQHLAFATNLTLTVQTWFHHTFNNLVTFTNPTDDVWVPVPLPDIVFYTNLSLLTVQTTTDHQHHDLHVPNQRGGWGILYSANESLRHRHCLPPSDTGQF